MTTTPIDTDVFVGSWNVASVVLPNGKPPYTGTVQIRRLGSVLDLQWDISDGSYFGIGLRAGDRLLVACGEQRAGLGVAFFRMEPGTASDVRWSSPELQGLIGSGETSAPFADRLSGDHEMTSYLPDGSVHGRWTVQVRPDGDIYEVFWRKGGSPSRSAGLGCSEALHGQGLGIAVPGGLAVGWYPDIAQLALLVYRLETRDRLEALWALGGFNVLGSERLDRI